MKGCKDERMKEWVKNVYLDTNIIGCKNDRMDK